MHRIHSNHSTALLVHSISLAVLHKTPSLSTVLLSQDTSHTYNALELYMHQLCNTTWIQYMYTDMDTVDNFVSNSSCKLPTISFELFQHGALSLDHTALCYMLVEFCSSYSFVRCCMEASGASVNKALHGIHYHLHVTAASVNSTPIDRGDRCCDKCW